MQKRRAGRTLNILIAIRKLCARIGARPESESSQATRWEIEALFRWSAAPLAERDSVALKRCFAGYPFLWSPRRPGRRYPNGKADNAVCTGEASSSNGQLSARAGEPAVQPRVIVTVPRKQSYCTFLLLLLLFLQLQLLYRKEWLDSLGLTVPVFAASVQRSRPMRCCNSNGCVHAP